ncbi:3008_t:CDS:10 [Diversispora eburnea]|uniref:3008_t:CDS:1 n=1 Tax=Diversispora eburnea TaxID=1213867 RepID=A0A9N9A8M8_9GLOM|nr:3008_t:CDS:10 [Diversispora eburnea]
MSSSSSASLKHFSTYNIHYLRISAKQVLPLILYIKPDNINWFNDIIFQCIAEVSIIDILMNSLMNSLMSSLMTNFQMAYYFKPTDTRHSILVKITYEGFAIFRKSLVVIVEPLCEIVEFGNNVRTVSYMSIDDYFAIDEEEENCFHKAYVSKTIEEMMQRENLFKTLELLTERIQSLWEPLWEPSGGGDSSTNLSDQWAWTNWSSLKLVLAMVYIERLRKANPCFHGEQGCSHRVFFIAFVIASKYVDASFSKSCSEARRERRMDEWRSEDNEAHTLLLIPHNNSYYWSNITNHVFTPNEITRMEIDFLYMLKFNLLVKKEDIIECWQRCMNNCQIVPAGYGNNFSLKDFKNFSNNRLNTTIYDFDNNHFGGFIIGGEVINYGDGIKE